MDSSRGFERFLAVRVLHWLIYISPRTNDSYSLKIGIMKFYISHYFIRVYTYTMSNTIVSDDDNFMLKKDGVYIIKSLNYFFLIRVSGSKREYGTKHMIVVTPGPDNSNPSMMPDISSDVCLEISIKVYTNTVTACIESLAHEDMCSMCKTLCKKEGTYEMVMSTLSFCSKLFNVDTFDLYDASSFYCDPVDTITIGIINMKKHNLLVYGSSWYERIFNAIPTGRTDQVLWSNAKSRVETTVDRPTIEELLDIYRSNIPEDLMNMLIKVTDKHLKKSSSWTTVFEELHRMDGGKGFIFFKDKFIIRLGKKSLFDIPSVDNWVIEIDKTKNDTYLRNYNRLH